MSRSLSTARRFISPALRVAVLAYAPLLFLEPYSFSSLPGVAVLGLLTRPLRGVTGCV